MTIRVVELQPTLVVSPIVSPVTVDAGQTAQLDVFVFGGSGSYTYVWSPASALDDPSSANQKDPRAKPSVTTQYTVNVTDSSPGGATGNASITVDVNLRVTASANPGAVDVGTESQLSATPTGGLPPYKFVWAPAESLDGATIQNPAAKPTVTTVYTATVTDAAGQAASTSTTVAVNLQQVDVVASPPNIAVGESSTLFAIVTGGTPPFTYQWAPTSTLDLSNPVNPVASPVATTTYVVTVTDSSVPPRSDQGSATVTVVSTGEAVACFTSVPPNTQPAIANTSVTFDASCSRGGFGTITEYRWWMPFFEGNIRVPDFRSSGPTWNATFPSGLVGPFQAKLEIFVQSPTQNGIAVVILDYQALP